MEIDVKNKIIEQLENELEEINDKIKNCECLNEQKDFIFYAVFCSEARQIKRMIQLIQNL